MPAFGLTSEAARIVVVASTAIIWSSLVLAIRIFLRLQINGPFGWDDVACIAATILGIIHSAITLLEIKYGLGRSDFDVSDADISIDQFLLWLTNIIYISAISCSILSVCFLIARICTVQRKVWVAHILSAVSAIWALLYVFLYAFQCRLPEPWNISRPRHCINLWALYASAISGKTVLEVCNIAAALNIVWGLQMSMKAKASVMVLFATRLLIIPPTITRLRFIHKALFGTDWSRDRVDVVIISQIVLHLSIILATVPCAKPFLQMCESGGLHVQMPVKAATALLPISRERARVDGKSASYYTAKLSGRKGHRTRAERWRVTLRPDHSRTVTTISHSPGETGGSMARRGSMGTMQSGSGILRTDEVHVVYEDAGGVRNQFHLRHGVSVENWRLPRL